MKHLHAILPCHKDTAAPGPKRRQQVLKRLVGFAQRISLQIEQPGNI